jgi:hypothetical protein
LISRLLLISLSTASLHIMMDANCHSTEEAFHSH